MTIWKREAPKVLVVDDEVRIQSVLSESLQPTYTTTTAGSGEEAMALVSESRFDVILLDIHMPGMDGLEVLEVVKRQHPETVVIILTGYASVDNAVHALRHGAFNYLQKPISHEEILESIAEGLVYAQDERQRREVLLKISARGVCSATPYRRCFPDACLLVLFVSGQV